jgi:hypothetical protein
MNQPEWISVLDAPSVAIDLNLPLMLSLFVVNETLCYLMEFTDWFLHHDSLQLWFGSWCPAFAFCLLTR